MDIGSFWRAFLRDTHRPQDTAYYDCFHFTDDERLADELLALVLDGRKRATSSNLAVYRHEGEPLPKPGSLSVVTNWANEPRCVIQTQAVTLIRFGDMTYDICRREGEDDALESWRRDHALVFTMECAELGIPFTEDTTVVFEDFCPVYWLLGDGARCAVRLTDGGDGELGTLCAALDAELDKRYGAPQRRYDALNRLDELAHALVLSLNGKPVACGGLKPHGADALELKRVYVSGDYRGRGLAKLVVRELEAQARLSGASRLLLETGMGQPEAIGLYEQLGYERVPAFAPYGDSPNSICMQKVL